MPWRLPDGSSLAVPTPSGYPPMAPPRQFTPKGHHMGLDGIYGQNTNKCWLVAGRTGRRSENETVHITPCQIIDRVAQIDTQSAPNSKTYILDLPFSACVATAIPHCSYTKLCVVTAHHLFGCG